MRPDEHKKKHRAEYKKKHGISNKKTTSKEKNETDKGTNSTESQENDALPETEEGDQKQFSRRNISSNWDKYEDLEDTSDEEGNSENIIRRGEDFNVLLQRSANPASQFRFQSEKDWDQEIEGDPGTTQTTSSALEIDFGALAASLNCVPLHKRLDISADVIHPDVIEVFELNAQACLKDQCISPSKEGAVIKPGNSTTIMESRPSKENASQHTELQVSHSKTNKQDLMKRSHQQSGNDSSKQLTHSLKDNDADLFQAKHSGFASDLGTLHNTENLQNSLKDVFSTVNTANTSKTGTAEQVVQSDNNEEDDELEFLLSLGTPGGNSNGRKPSSKVQSNKLTSSVKDSSSTVNPPAVQTAKKSEDDLEDWLDSVLG